MLTTLSAMLRRNNKTDAAVQAARTVKPAESSRISGRPDDDTEHIYGGAAGSEERDRQRFHSSAVLDQGHHSADVYRTHQRGGCSYSDHHARNDFRAVTQSAAGMDGVQKEALDKFGQALTEFLQSTLDHAQEKQNADPEQ